MPWTVKHFAPILRSRSATALAAGTEATVLEIQALAPKVSGTLANSVKGERPVSSGDRYRARITVTAPHAEWVYNGTGFFGPRRSPIVPVTAPMLVFEYAGVEIHAANVAGQRPNKAWWDGPLEHWKANVAAAYASRFGR